MWIFALVIGSYSVTVTIGAIIIWVCYWKHWNITVRVLLRHNTRALTYVSVWGLLETHPRGHLVAFYWRWIVHSSFEKGCVYVCMNYPSCIKASARPTFTHRLYVFQVKWRREDSQSDYINTISKTTRYNKRKLHIPTMHYFYAPNWFWANNSSV